MRSVGMLETGKRVCKFGNCKIMFGIVAGRMMLLQFPGTQKGMTYYYLLLSIFLLFYFSVKIEKKVIIW